MSDLSDDIEMQPAAAAPLPPVAADDAADAACDERIAAHVDAWFAKHFHGMGAQIDERLYALLHAAKEDLKRVLSLL